MKKPFTKGEVVEHIAYSFVPNHRATMESTKKGAYLL